MSMLAQAGRRRLLSAMALAAVPGVRAADHDPFAALREPAISVRGPDKAMLLSVASAGQRLVAVGERGVIALSDDGARSWRQAAAVPTRVSLTAVRFADAKTGWSVGHGGVVLVTLDGGEHWTLQADGRSLAGLAEQAAREHPENPALAKEAALLVADGPDKPLLDLHVVDAKHVFVVGAYNLAFESVDGGRSWRSALERLDNPKARHINAMAVRDGTWLLAGEQGLLLRSRDGGRSFQRLESPYAGSWFSVLALGSREWLVAGLKGKVYRTTDDGEGWAALDGAPPASIVSAAALAGGRALLANQAGQLFTTHAGSPLSAVAAPTLPPVTQVLPLTGGDLVVLTLAGIVRVPAKGVS